MDADERVLEYAARNARSKLGWPPIGTPEGTRNNHYESCPDLRIEVVGGGDGYCWSGTCERWTIEARVACPHGEVITSTGVVPLVPVTVELDGWGTLGELIAELDEV